MDLLNGPWQRELARLPWGIVLLVVWRRIGDVRHRTASPLEWEVDSEVERGVDSEVDRDVSSDPNDDPLVTSEQSEPTASV